MSIIKLIISVFVIGIIIQLPVYAQFVIPASVVSGGGGEMSNDNFQSTVAIGQTTIGNTVNNSNINNIGFLYQALYADSITFDIDEYISGMSTAISLEQNYPNPFNSTTAIMYSLRKAEFITLTIYDMFGKEVQTLVNEYQTTGSYTVDFAADELSKGIYLYRLQVGNFSASKKMQLLQ